MSKTIVMPTACLLIVLMSGCSSNRDTGPAKPSAPTAGGAETENAPTDSSQIQAGELVGHWHADADATEAYAGNAEMDAKDRAELAWIYRRALGQAITFDEGGKLGFKVALLDELRPSFQRGNYEVTARDGNNLNVTMKHDDVQTEREFILIEKDLLAQKPIDEPLWIVYRRDGAPSALEASTTHDDLADGMPRKQVAKWTGEGQVTQKLTPNRRVVQFLCRCERSLIIRMETANGELAGGISRRSGNDKLGWIPAKPEQDYIVTIDGTGEWEVEAYEFE